MSAKELRRGEVPSRVRRGKAWKTSANSAEGSHRNNTFPTLSTVPWKSLARFPHSHNSDDDAL